MFGVGRQKRFVVNWNLSTECGWSIFEDGHRHWHRPCILLGPIQTMDFLRKEFIVSDWMCFSRSAPIWWTTGTPLMKQSTSQPSHQRRKLKANPLVVPIYFRKFPINMNKKVACIRPSWQGGKALSFNNDWANSFAEKMLASKILFTSILIKLVALMWPLLTFDGASVMWVQPPNRSAAKIASKTVSH